MKKGLFSRFISTLLLAAVFFNLGKAGAGADPNPGDEASAAAMGRVPPEFIWGVTVDDVAHLGDVLDALSSLKKRPVARVVFDEFVDAPYYQQPVAQIHQVAGVMGEILDSSQVKKYSLQQYKERTNQYVHALGNTVDIWEVGNEINGEWLKAGAMDKAAAAYDIVKANKGKTALTLYYNFNCWSHAENEMFQWAEANVPDRMKHGLDYVLISYYEHDCNDYKPDWQKVFDRLHGMFPDARIGFGEVGSDKGDEADYLPRYYHLQITTPNYIGGFFWWYFREQMVPKSKPMWKVLNDSLPNLPDSFFLGNHLVDFVRLLYIFKPASAVCE